MKAIGTHRINMEPYAFEDFLPGVCTYFDEWPIETAIEQRAAGHILFMSEATIYANAGGYRLRPMDYTSGVEVPIDTTMTMRGSFNDRVFCTHELKAYQRLEICIPTILCQFYDILVEFRPRVDSFTQYGEAMSTESRRSFGRMMESAIEKWIYSRSLDAMIGTCGIYRLSEPFGRDRLIEIRDRFYRYEKLRRCYLLVRLQRAIKSWLLRRISWRMRRVHCDVRYLPGGEHSSAAYKKVNERDL